MGREPFFDEAQDCLHDRITAAQAVVVCSYAWLLEQQVRSSRQSHQLVVLALSCSKQLSLPLHLRSGI